MLDMLRDPDYQRGLPHREQGVARAGLVGGLRVIDHAVPSEPADMRTGALPSAAVDPATGHLFVVWQDVRFRSDGLNDVVITRSTDGGRSWLLLGRVNAESALQRRDNFTPDVAARGGELGEILLPGRYIPRDLKQGDKLDVFIYLDSEDRLVATTETPLATVGEFACLQIVSVNQRVGAFLNWGLSKDLLLPFREQMRV